MNRRLTDQPDPEWDDAAFAGCKAWLRGWRETNGPHVNPPKDRRLIAAVGRDAIQLMREGVPLVELQRVMWAAGRDGVTLGLTPRTAQEGDPTP